MIRVTGAAGFLGNHAARLSLERGGSRFHSLGMGLGVETGIVPAPSQVPPANRKPPVFRAVHVPGGSSPGPQRLATCLRQAEVFRK